MKAADLAVGLYGLICLAARTWPGQAARELRVGRAAHAGAVPALYGPGATGRGARGGCAITTVLVAWPELRAIELHAGLHGVAVDVLLPAGVSLATGPDPRAASFVADAL